MTFFNQYRTPFEIISWSLTLLAVIAGVVMRSNLVSVNVIQWSGFVIAITTAVNQFLNSSVLKGERNGNKKDT